MDPTEPPIDLERWRAGSATMRFEGHDIAVYEGGDAAEPPLLLVHGFPTAACS